MENNKKGFFENYFQISKNNSSVKIEIIAGITTFITIAYILILNPIIMSDPFMILGKDNPALLEMAGHLKNGVFIGTCIGAFIGTILVSLYAKLPLAQAPGMGLNAFFAYTVCLGMGYSYAQSLVVVLISGILFIVITLVGLREAIIRSIPDCIKSAITPGIGLFITIIGLKNAGIVVDNPATLVQFVDFSKWGAKDVDTVAIAGALVALIGFLIIGILHSFKVKGSIIIGILAGTVIGIPFGVTTFHNLDFNLANKFSDFTNYSLFQLDFAGLIKDGNIVTSLFTVFMIVLSFSLVNMFDSIGTLLGAAKQSGLITSNGEIYRMKQALMSDAISTAAGALVGTSTVTTVVESSAGIAAGGRTGLTSFVTAILFIAAIIFAPVVSIIPTAAVSPALIFVGILMISNIKDVDFSDMTNALPAFCTIVFMPFTYSIANGIGLGLISYSLMKAFTGKIKEVKPLAIIVSVIFIIRYIFVTI